MFQSPILYVPLTPQTGGGGANPAPFKVVERPHHQCDDLVKPAFSHRVSLATTVLISSLLLHLVLALSINPSASVGVAILFYVFSVRCVLRQL